MRAQSHSCSTVLRHMSLFEHADKIESGVFAAIAHGERTGDLGGKLGTREFTESIIKRLGQKI